MRYWPAGTQDQDCVEGMTTEESAFEDAEQWVGAGVELEESVVSLAKKNVRP